MLPITKESINKVLEKVVFVEANVNGKSPEEVYVRDDDILLYLIMNDGNVLKATKDILDKDKAYPIFQKKCCLSYIQGLLTQTREFQSLNHI